MNDYPKRIFVAKREVGYLNMHDQSPALLKNNEEGNKNYIEYVRADLYRQKCKVADRFEDDAQELKSKVTKWHKYPDEKPKPYVKYNVTINTKPHKDVTTAYYSESRGSWILGSIATKDVIAWAEMPEPFKGE